MAGTNEIIQIINNGNFSEFISTEEKKNSANSNCYKSWLNQLSQVLSSDYTKILIKSDDVLRAIKVFCSGVELNNDSSIINYIKANLAILNYLIFTKNHEAIRTLHSYMLVSKAPLYKLSGPTQLNLYWKYLDSLMFSENKYEEIFIQNIFFTIIKLFKSHEAKFFMSKYVESIFGRLKFYISRIQKIALDRYVVHKFLEDLFVVLTECHIKPSEISCESYNILLSFLATSLEIMIDKNNDLACTAILFENLKIILFNVDDKCGMTLITYFQDYIVHNSSLDNLLSLLTKFNDKNEFNVVVIAYICRVLVKYLDVSNVPKISIDYKLFRLIQILIKYIAVDVTHPKYNKEAHRYIQLHRVIATLIPKLIQVLPKRELSDFYLKYIELLQKYLKSVSSVKFVEIKLYVRYFNITMQQLKKSNKIKSAENIHIFRDVFIEMIKTFLKSLKNNEDCLNEFKTSFVLIASIYMDLMELTSACYFYLLGVHFTNKIRFNYLFDIWHNNPGFTSSAYEILTGSVIAKQANIILDKNELVVLLLKELKAMNELWASRVPMRRTVKDIMQITRDPLTSARAISFLKCLTAEDLDNVNKTLENLESNLQFFQGQTLTLANLLLGNMYAMRYLALGNKYMCEMANAPSLVNQTPEEPDRDGLKHTNDSCYVNPVDFKLNIYEENLFVQHINKAIEYWSIGIKDIEHNQNDNEHRIHLELAWEVMDITILTLCERGSYDHIVYDLVMLGYNLAEGLNKPISALRSISHLLGFHSSTDQIDAIVSKCNRFVYKQLKCRMTDENDKSYFFNYLLGFVEYLWNNKNKDKAYFYGVAIVEKIKREAITDKIILAKLYWIESLLKIDKNTSRNSIFYLHSLVVQSLQQAINGKEITKFESRLRISTYFNFIIKIGNYCSYIYQARLVNFYLKPGLKLAQSFGLTHRIAQIVCILLRVDIIRQEYLDAQSKVSILLDILHQSRESKPSSAKKKIMKSVKSLIPNSKDFINKLAVSVEGYRDIKMSGSESPKLLTLAEIGSPPLAYRTFKLPDFFNHPYDCDCICCSNSNHFSLILTATSLEARLNCFLKNTKVTDKYFGICDKIRMVAESKQSCIGQKLLKYSSSLERKNNYTISVVLHLYDRCLHVAKNGNFAMIQNCIGFEERYVEDADSISREVLQDLMGLMTSFLFDKYTKKTNCHLGLPIPELKVTPEKIFNEQAFKTPACSKRVFKCAPNKIKFKIHQDISPPGPKVPHIKFNLIDCDDKDDGLAKKIKSASHGGTPAKTPKPIFKNKSTSNASSVKKSVKMQHPTPYKTPAPQRGNSFLKSSESSLSPVEQSDEEVFMTPMKFTKTPNKNAVSNVKKIRNVKNALIPEKDESSLEEDFATPMKFNEASNNLQKTMLKRNLKKKALPLKDSSSSMEGEDDVFLLCENKTSISADSATPIKNLKDNNSEEFYTPAENLAAVKRLKPKSTSAKPHARKDTKRTLKENKETNNQLDIINKKMNSLAISTKSSSTSKIKISKQKEESYISSAIDTSGDVDILNKNILSLSMLSFDETDPETVKVKKSLITAKQTESEKLKIKDNIMNNKSVNKIDSSVIDDSIIESKESKNKKEKSEKTASARPTRSRKKIVN